MRSSMGRIPAYVMVIGNQVLILIILTAGDSLVSSWRPEWIPMHIWALWDAPVHGLLAIMVVAPMFVRKSSSKPNPLYIALSALAPIMIDIDHFVASGSLSLYKATHLPFRPATHSLLFALACALLIRKITRDSDYAYLLFVALASHFVRDASSGGIPFLLWPFRFDRLSRPAYYAIQVGLSLATWAIYWGIPSQLQRWLVNHIIKLRVHPLSVVENEKTSQ